MVDNIVTKPLGIVLIVTAHMVFNGHSKEVTGILGNNITLEFILNATITKNSHIAVYRSGPHKIVECPSDSYCSESHEYDVSRGTVSVFCHISNLKRNHSDIYWASLFIDLNPPKESDKVKLSVREDNRSSTDSPMPTYSTIPEHRGTSNLFVFYIVTVLVVLCVVLLAAVLSWLIWCLVRTKDKQQQQRQSSYPTVQETVQASNIVPAPSVVYSILDFPKRPPAVLEMSPNDTEYAAVSYLPEQKRV